MVLREWEEEERGGKLPRKRSDQRVEEPGGRKRLLAATAVLDPFLKRNQLPSKRDEPCRYKILEGGREIRKEGGR